MKKNLFALALSGLLIGGIVSCKKVDTVDDDTTTTTTPADPINPLTTKLCSGEGTITVDNVNDSMHSTEQIITSKSSKFFSVLCDGKNTALTITTGDNKLPSDSKTYTVLYNAGRVPYLTEALVTYYDDVNGKEYAAMSGTVSYNINTFAKVVRFNKVQFRAKDGTQTKTISFVVNLQ
jgi:hypothetical protein